MDNMNTIMIGIYGSRQRSESINEIYNCLPREFTDKEFYPRIEDGSLECEIYATQAKKITDAISCGVFDDKATPNDQLADVLEALPSSMSHIYANKNRKKYKCSVTGTEIYKFMKALSETKLPKGSPMLLLGESHPRWLKAS